jgi:hypothetical protein
MLGLDFINGLLNAGSSCFKTPQFPMLEPAAKMFLNIFYGRPGQPYANRGGSLRQL